MALPIHVDGYSAYRLNERPVGFELDGVYYRIYALEDQWYFYGVRFPYHGLHSRSASGGQTVGIRGWGSSARVAACSEKWTAVVPAAYHLIGFRPRATKPHLPTNSFGVEYLWTPHQRFRNSDIRRNHLAQPHASVKASLAAEPSSRQSPIGMSLALKLPQFVCRHQTQKVRHYALQL